MPGPDETPLEESDVQIRDLQEARRRLYRPDVTEADRDAYRRLSELHVALRPSDTSSNRVTSSAPRRRRRWAGLVLPTAIGALLLLAGVPVLNGATPPPRPLGRMSSALTLRFDLADISLRQRLAQYPSTVQSAWQGTAVVAEREDAAGFTMLAVPDRYFGKEQLLVVRCATTAGSWEAHMFSSTYGAQSLRAEGACGEIGTAVVPAGIGAVSVQVKGERQFDSVLLARR